jgi:acetyl esterase/lipase
LRVLEVRNLARDEGWIQAGRAARFQESDCEVIFARDGLSVGAKNALFLQFNTDMKTPKLFVFFLLAVIVSLVLGRGARADVTPQTEVYGTASDGTVLHWNVYTPAGSGPWPAMLVIHGGGFDEGSPTSAQGSIDCAQALAAAGYIAFSIEYRLAPPGLLPGQVSDGRFPDQSDDVNLAVRTARADSRCNGQVGAIGGSAGGYHTAFAATTGTKGYDRIDVGVCLSGLYDAADFSPSAHLAGYTANVTNYVGVATTDTATLRAASPAWLADADTAPLFLVNSVGDSMPYVQLPKMMLHLDALGLTNYQTLTLAGALHSFATWSSVKDAALAFIANGFAGVPPPPPLPPPAPNAGSKQLVNVSTRADVKDGEDVMIGGFIIDGTVDKRLVLRAIGPSLGLVGLSGVLADPVLDLYDSSGDLVESNDNRELLAGVPNPLLPADPAESFLAAVLPPGRYTAILHGVGSASGLGLVELYDLDPASSTVGNISTRADAGAGNDEMIGGFIVGGLDPTKVLVRALGPSLGALGIAAPLPNPVLDLRDGNGNLLFTNDNWRSDQEQEIRDSTLAPTDNRESAIIATLQPGSYTALVHDATFATGVGLIEAYNMEP